MEQIVENLFFFKKNISVTCYGLTMHAAETEVFSFLSLSGSPTELGATGHASKEEGPLLCPKEKSIPSSLFAIGREEGGPHDSGQCRQTLVRKEKKVLFALLYVPQKFNGSFDLNFTTLNE